jgi:branched-chain amino acid transport system ATP-binding protein
MISPAGGTIRYQGTDVTGWSSDKVCDIGIGQVAEGRQIFPSLTVMENLEMGAMPKRARAQEKQNLDRVLAMFPRLGERRRQAAGTLSGGEQQMLAIGRALLARPKLLMLDEPSLGLAPQVVQTVFQVIREIAQEGTTILLIEQNASMALQVANRAYVLEVGEIQMEGRAGELAASDEVRKAYLGAH